MEGCPVKSNKAQLDRIQKAEQCFDACCIAVRELAAALETFEKTLPALQALDAYYQGGDWLRDYAADEAGLLPPDMKRGVLSQDAPGDLLDDVCDAARQMETLTEKLRGIGLYSASI